MGQFIGRFRHYGDRIVAQLPTSTHDAARTKKLYGKEEWDAAYAEVQKCEESLQPFARKVIDPDGPHAAPFKMLQERLQRARERLRKAEFMAFDHALKVPTMSERLAAINRANREFWEGRKSE